MAGTRKSAGAVDGILLKVLLFGAFIGFIILLFSIAHDPKTPVTVNQAEGILKEHGFEPVDTTDIYKKQMTGNVRTSFRRSLTVLSGDIQLTFFDFNDDNGAESLRSHYRSWIHKNRYSVPNIEHESGISNYAAYTLKAAGKYSLIVRVGNTVVFAISDESSAGRIHDVMVALGYFDEK